MTARVLYLDLSEPCIDHGLKGNAQGYARIFVRGEDRKMLRHRYVFWKHFGYLPPVVMHGCDNTRCINPKHLGAGDWDLNNKERAAKGRSHRALKAKRKLTDSQAAEIRRRYALRKPAPRRDRVNGVVALAREFGVDCNVIYQIASGRTYFA